MVLKGFSRAKKNEPVPRRRRIAQNEGDALSTPRQASLSGQYRRNQTLSSYRYNTPDESARQKAHHLVVQRRRLGGIFLIVVAVSTVLLLLVWQLMVQIRITTSTKQVTTTVTTELYERYINEYLNLNPAQRLRFALDEAALSAYVSSFSPEVEQVRIKGASGIAQTDASVTFRTPVAGWQINNKQYYVDANGVVFEKNYYAAPTVQIVDESGITPENGGALVGTRLLGFLGRAVSEAKGRGYIVTQAVLPEGTAREVDIYFEDIRTRIKLSVDRGAGEQLEDAQRSLNYLRSRGVTPEYIDVRVAGRAAYK